MRICITIPVLNEEVELANTVQTVDEFVQKRLRTEYEIVIADNGSTDNTLDVALNLAKTYDSVRVLHLPERGRGRALKKAWLDSSAELLSYMDVDLSTDLEAFPIMIGHLQDGEFDLVAGSRLHRNACVKRGLKRETISRSYNMLVKLIFQNRFSDAQCGFKGVRREAAIHLLPLVRDEGWFFDTELLILSLVRIVEVKFGVFLHG